MIVWASNVNINGTCLQGNFVSPWSFEETVARIYASSGQPVFEQTDEYKVSFEAVGFYVDDKGKTYPFSLYDWKGWKEIHLGGHSGLPAQTVMDEIIALLEKAVPKPFHARIHYDEAKGQTYSYEQEPPRTCYD